MKNQYCPVQMEHTNFQNFELIYEGIKKKGLYLLEYYDSYLKDAFVTQVAELFIKNGTDALFIQEEQTQYSLRDIFLSRTLFKQNPQDFPSISQITQESVALLNPPFEETFDNFEQRVTIISTKSKYPLDYIDSLYQAVRDNSQIKLVIIDSHTDYFYRSNIVPQLSRMSFNENIIILFTSQISAEKIIDKSIFLPSFLKNSLYLHSKHPDLFTLADSKGIVYEFELDIRTPSNKRKKSHYTLRPASAYCQEG